MNASMLLPVLFLAIHSFYFSLTKVNHNQENRSLEITMKFFTDDLDRALSKEVGQKLRLGTRKEADSTDVFLEEYIRKHTSYHIDSLELHFDFIGKEVLMEQTYVYAEILNVDSVGALHVKSTLLHNAFSKQVNEIRLQAKNQIKSIQLSKNQSQGTIELENEK